MFLEELQKILAATFHQFAKRAVVAGKLFKLFYSRKPDRFIIDLLPFCNGLKVCDEIGMLRACIEKPKVPRLNLCLPPEPNLLCKNLSRFIIGFFNFCPGFLQEV